MTFDEYQVESNKTAQYPKESALYYCGLGLTGEAGEVAEKLKKVLRNDGGVISEEKKLEIKKEIGDVLWYAAQLSTILEISFDEVAQGNIDKLSDRLARGVVKSEGDNR
jgi:NTP pyrophosphatase (non-canonical NTP hydrolase)